jgi:hypothetical protein
VLAVSACQQAGDDGTPAEKTPQPNPAASAAPSTAAPDTMTCTDPVRPDDTAASLIERYKEEARVETLYGVEGDELPGVVLWPNDSARRVEVIFAEEAREQVAGVLVSGAMKRRAAGLAVGDPIA